MRYSTPHALALAMVFIGTLGAQKAQAQPSDAKIVKDLTSPGVLSVKLLGRGARVWSKTDLQYLWERNAIVTRSAGLKEYPDVKLEVGGIATYSIVGGNYPFKKFYVTYNSYSGIPAPTAKEIVTLLNTDLPKFLGHHYNNIVGDVQPVALAADPKWEWHTPNSVSFLVTTGFEEKISNTQLEKKKMTYEVRLYRDKIKDPWQRFIASPKDEVSQGKTTREADDIAAMKTLNVIDAERQANAQLSSLPDVEIPAFKTDLELFAFLHQALRAGDAKKGEAILRRSLAPVYFETGSEVLLNARGEELVQSVVKNAYKAKSNYAEQYGPELSVKHYQPNMLEFWNADGRHFSRIQVEPSGGTWENGVKVGQTLKITDLDVAIITNADEIARLRSMPPETRFALPAGAKPFSQLGQQVVAEQKAVEQAKVVQAIQWTPFTSANARLQIAFPAPPKETEGKMNNKYPMWTVEATHPEVMCRAVSIVYGTKLNRMQAQATVESAIKGLAQNNGATIKRQSDLNEGTFGRLATLEADDTVIKVRAFVQGEVLYQLIMASSPATMATLNDREFFGSFQIP